MEVLLFIGFNHRQVKGCKGMNYFSADLAANAEVFLSNVTLSNVNLYSAL